MTEKTDNSVTVKSGINKVVMRGAPFRLDLYTGDQLTISANARGLFRFENHQTKPQPYVPNTVVNKAKIKLTLQSSRFYYCKFY